MTAVVLRPIGNPSENSPLHGIVPPLYHGNYRTPGSIVEVHSGRLPQLVYNQPIKRNALRCLPEDEKHVRYTRRGVYRQRLGAVE